MNIEDIKIKFKKALINTCKEENCKLFLNKLNDYAILKGELINPDKKMCDCIIFTLENDFIIGLVELKSKTTHADEISKKLNNASKIALDILKDFDKSSFKIRFFPVLLSKGYKDTELRSMRKEKINFRGKKYDIICKRCGTSFSEIISTYT